MGGICGFTGSVYGEHEKTINKMLFEQRHRGSECRGYHVVHFEDQSVVIGHNKLSIFNMSTTNHQPLTINELSIVMDGRIYNYAEIKKELIDLGHVFDSNDEAEVILHSYQEWGCECVHHFIGMFVFVIVDSIKGELLIFRDRSGTRPLFYYYDNGNFIFSSELKSFHYHPAFIKKINFRAIDIFMKFGYVLSPYCIFENCYKLDPGHYLTYKISCHSIELKKYWSVFEYYAKPKLSIDYQEAKVELERILKSAFLYRMIADVPVGVFLSGGYDSSAVASLLQSSMTDKLKTYTIGVHVGNNDAPYAQMVAKYLGTEHTEYYCTEKEAGNIIPDLPYYYDEPFADSSAIPTMLVSKIARNEVSVALSADGGDEIFAGYDLYRMYLNNMSVLKKIPEFAHDPIACFFKYLQHLYPDKFQKTKRRLIILEDVFKSSNLKKREKLFLGTVNHSAVFFEKNIYQSLNFEQKCFEIENNETDIKDDLSFALAFDYYLSLPSDSLTKVDRATMSVSLESREPLLDHRIVEFVAQLPNEFKMDNTNSKIILKDIVHKYLPKDMMNRPKVGFSIPIYKWLREDFGYYIDEYLNERVVTETGVFNYEYVSYIKNLFMNGRLHDKVALWKLLMFHMWAKRWFI